MLFVFNKIMENIIVFGEWLFFNGFYVFEIMIWKVLGNNVLNINDLFFVGLY